MRAARTFPSTIENTSISGANPSLSPRALRCLANSERNVAVIAASLPFFHSVIFSRSCRSLISRSRRSSSACRGSGPVAVGVKSSGCCCSMPIRLFQNFARMFRYGRAGLSASPIFCAPYSIARSSARVAEIFCGPAAVWISKLGVSMVASTVRATCASCIFGASSRSFRSIEGPSLTKFALPSGSDVSRSTICGSPLRNRSSSSSISLSHCATSAALFTPNGRPASRYAATSCFSPVITATGSAPPVARSTR